VSSLTVWLYPTAFGAETGELQLKGLVERGEITLHDAATVQWMPHDEAPVVRRVTHRGAKSAGRGAVWGGLVGLVVLNPVAGAALADQRLRRAGLDKGFVEQVRGQLRPGTSALLVLSSDADPDAIRAFLARTEATLLHADLSAEGQRLLEEVGLESPGTDP
jgi:uncharacterized membrane protein